MPRPNSNGPDLNVTTLIATLLEALLYGTTVSLSDDKKV
jgi:hypothetical protein